jgi:6-phosphogluconolactonase
MQTLMFVGSCNGRLGYVAHPAGKGITAFRVDLETGASGELASTTDIPNPTFVTVSPDGATLLAASEFDGEVEGAVTAFAIDAATGTLRQLGRAGSRGWTTAHLGFDRTGRFAAAANYGAVPADAPAGASVVVYDLAAPGGIPIAAEATHTGKGPNAARQERPHAHCVRWSPDNRFLLVADLGIDRVVVYRFDVATGGIAPHGEIALPAGDGPRHFTFHPRGHRLYVVNELSSTVASFAYDAHAGTARLIGEASTLPAGGHAGNSCSAIAISPEGRHLIAANRGHDSLATFAVDTDGIARLTVTTPCGGAVPRDLSLDPSGRILAVANQASDTVNLFRFDAERDGLTPLGAPIPSGSPTAIAFLPRFDTARGERLASPAMVPERAR